MSAGTRPRRGLGMGVGRRPRKLQSAGGAAFQAQVEVRRRVLEALGQAGVGSRVFDAYAGRGDMWRAVWREAEGYVGCDREWYRDGRVMFAADNRRVLRAIDLKPFTVFDLDAWGSPWLPALIIAARRPLERGERIGLAITEGSGLHLRHGGYPDALRLLAGVRGRPAGGARGHAELTSRALCGLMRRMGARVERQWEAEGRSGAQMRYLGVVVVGV